MGVTSETIAFPWAEQQRLSFQVAWDTHRARVFHWALRYGVGDRGWAEDLTHDVFLKLWAELPYLTDREDLGGWLYTVTARTAVSRLRERTGLVAALRRWLDPEPPPGPDVALDARRVAHAALDALERLPARERVVLLMVALDALPQHEVAARLRLSQGYVSKLLERGRTRLRALGWELP